MEGIKWSPFSRSPFDLYFSCRRHPRIISAAPGARRRSAPGGGASTGEGEQSIERRSDGEDKRVSVVACSFRYLFLIQTKPPDNLRRAGRSAAPRASGGASTGEGEQSIGEREHGGY